MVNKDCRKNINIDGSNILGIKINSNLEYEVHAGDLCKEGSSFFWKCKAINLPRKHLTFI